MFLSNTQYSYKWVRLNVVLLLLLFCIVPVIAQDDMESIPTVEHDPTVAVEWMDLLYRVVEGEALSAPAAARVYGYGGVILYEAVVNGMPENFSLTGQVQELPMMPLPDEGLVMDWPSVANGAMGVVAPTLFIDPMESTLTAIADRQSELVELRSTEIDETVLEDSLAYGESIGALLVEWIASDGYADIVDQDYELPTGGPEIYVLTNPDIAPIEPYWGTLRPLAMYYPEVCNLPLNMAFDEDPDSTFYKQSLEVKNVADNRTEEQEEIARFWIDTPGITGAPSGHWVSIQNQMVEQLDMNLQQASGMYVQTNMAISDAFISAWVLKYEVMLLRPETYIQTYIQRNWQPYVSSPAFPEYPSGHSVVSGAASEVLTHLLGQVAFTDRTHIIYDHEPLQRSFRSFEHAEQEAAFSRMYGGIHYRVAIENGVRQGRCVGQQVIDNIRLGPIQQGTE
jgi:hypothetical protein